MGQNNTMGHNNIGQNNTMGQMGLAQGTITNVPFMQIS